MASNKDISIINPDIVSICQSIGRFDKDAGIYLKDDQCAVSLRDLLREIKKEQEPFLGRRQLAVANVVGTDLIPLIRDHCLEDEELLRIILRLLVILTTSAIYSMGDTVPEEKDRKRLFLELQQDTSKYKLLFSSQFKVWAVLGVHLTRVLSMDWEARSTNDEMLIEAIFILVTNLLHVSCDANSTLEDNPHDRLIHLLDQSGITELVLLAASDSSGKFHMYALEIFSLLLRDQCPRTLALLDQESKKEKKPFDPDLAKIAARDDKTVKHRRFKDSTYQIKNLKSLSDRDMIYHKELNADGTISLGQKQIVRKARKRQNMKESDFGAQVYDELSIHQSPMKILLHLSKMCHEFLAQYNELMSEAKSHITRSQNQGDNTLYLWAVAFFMEFNRHCKKDVSLVSYTYTLESLHFLHTLLLTALDQLRTEKKSCVIPSRRLHYALKAYKELICTLAFADASDDIEFHEVTKKIKWIAFYEEEYRELLPMLLKEYNPVKMSRRYLIDLVSTTHVFLRLFKSYCAINPSAVVREKGRRPRKSKKAAREKWRMMIDEIRDCLAGKTTLPTAEEDPDVIPIDPTADLEADAQKTSIVYRIKKLLEEEKPMSAIALYRNARDAYIEDEEQPFGSDASTLEEEETALKAIYEEVTIDDDDQDDGPVTRERQLNFVDFFKKFCVPKAVIPHVLLLRDFDKNSSKTNHAVVKFLYRIAFDYDLHGMLFQACIFRIFQRIFKQPITDEWSRELNQFAKHVVRKFFETYPKNNKILVEILFWKTSRDAKALDEGYGPTDNDRGGDSDNEPLLDDRDGKEDEDALLQTHLDDSDDDVSVDQLVADGLTADQPVADDPPIASKSDSSDDSDSEADVLKDIDLDEDQENRIRMETVGDDEVTAPDQTVDVQRELDAVSDHWQSDTDDETAPHPAKLKTFSKRPSRVRVFDSSDDSDSDAEPTVVETNQQSEPAAPALIPDSSDESDG